MNAGAPSRLGVLVIAHGSRKPGWGEAAEGFRDAIAARMPNALVAVAMLAFSEKLPARQLRWLHSEGATSIVVVPLFIAPGGHVTEELPAVVAAFQAEFPNCNVDVRSPIGMWPTVLEAVAETVATRLL